MKHLFRYFIFSVFVFFNLPHILTLIILFVLLFTKWRQCVGIILVSWCFVFCYGTFYWPQKLPIELHNKKVTVKGIIDSTPVMKKQFCQFTLLIKDINGNEKIKKYRIKISDYKKTAKFSKGDELTAKIKIKQFRDYLNPGSQLYSKMQYARALSGKGYILKLISHKASSPSLLTIVRQSLAKSIHSLYKKPFSFVLMNSLLIGERTYLTSIDWQRFQLTGTSHLIAISGLHVGLVAAVFFIMVSFLWRLSPFLCNKFAAHRAAALCALFAAFFYSLISGFSIPTQRAFLMSFVFLSAQILNKKTHIWHSYELSMFLVLLFNPFSIFFAGFYLSFFVVFILIWFSSSSVWNVIQVQLKIWVLLLPISLYIFHYYSLISIPANLISIPAVSFILLPLGFLSILISYIWLEGALLLAKGLSLVIDGLNNYLAYLSTFQQVAIYYFPQSLFIVILVSFLFFYALNLNKVRWWVGTIILSCLLLLPYKRTINQSEAVISVLDVGQGLSVFIQTKKHALLYDTGGRFYGGFDLGKVVVVPFLMSQGIYNLDSLVISHEDLDHRGGFESIYNKISVKKVFRNGKRSFENCHKAKSWQWDGLVFRFLSFKKASVLSENNRSCVLMIENDFQRFILPGDIESEAELKLVKKYGDRLKATAMVAPHHGSKTSSSLSFLTQVLPHYVFISSGENNRYHLPHQKVLKRYHQLGIGVLNTAHSGMVEWTLSNNNKVQPPYFWGGSNLDLLKSSA